MAFTSKQIAGFFLFLAAAQFLLLLIVAESLYPNYSVANNYISDLGVGSTAIILNTSVFLRGLFIILSAYFCMKAFGDKVFSSILGVAGLAMLGIALFPETTSLHIPFAITAFFFASVAILATYRIAKPPLPYLAAVLGVIALIALIFFVTQIDLGIGKGGMERMITYPIMIWGLALGGYLMSPAKK